MKAISRDRSPSFFLIMSFVGLMASVIGFAKTFFIPVAAGKFEAPPIIHIHGALAFTWIALFVMQPALIHFQNYRLHQTLGMFGFLIAVCITITMFPVGAFVVYKELSQGLGEGAYSLLPGVITSGLLFLGLVSAGVSARKKPDYHKRFMLLATIVVLWPAWFRFRHYFPSVPRPEIWFGLVLADSLIVIAWIWDRLKNGRIHPVLKYIGSLIIIEQSLEVTFFNSSTYQSVGKWMYSWIYT